MKYYFSISNRSGEAIEGGGCSHRPIFNRSEVQIEGGCSCPLVFNKKRVLIEGGTHAGSFSIEKEC